MSPLERAIDKLCGVPQVRDCRDYEAVLGQAGLRTNRYVAECNRNEVVARAVADAARRGLIVTDATGNIVGRLQQV